MAQRIDAGSFLPSFDHVDDHGLLHPSSHAGGGGGGGGGRRPPIYYDDHTEYDSDDATPYSYSHSPHPQAWNLGQSHDREGQYVPDLRWSPSPEPEHQFFIIREGTPATPPLRDLHLRPNNHRQPQYHHHHHASPHHSPPNRDNATSPAPVACFMERTDSGRTILTKPDLLQPADGDDYLDFQDDDDIEAARRVEQHLASSARSSVRRHERILRTLINPPRGANKAAAGADDFRLDNAALESIFSAADALFFQGRLTRRVQWEWSSGAVSMAGGSPTTGNNNNNTKRIIGTTALRKADRGGYETLIVLSSPILTDTAFNRRLLISTFLHELIHSYLFIWCGFKARHCGGHTKGFRAIAETIDRWEGTGSLRLGDVQADLEHFREEQPLVSGKMGAAYSPPVVCHHQGGGSDVLLYNEMVLSSSHEHGVEMEGRWSGSASVARSHASSPMSTVSTLVENGGWGAYDGLDGAPRCADHALRGHTFLGAALQPAYTLH